MVVETLKLGIAILNGGNAGVQQVLGTQVGSAHFPGYSQLTLLQREPPRITCVGVLPLVANYIRVAGNTDKTRARRLQINVCLIKRVYPWFKEKNI